MLFSTLQKVQTQTKTVTHENVKVTMVSSFWMLMSVHMKISIFILLTRVLFLFSIFLILRFNLAFRVVPQITKYVFSMKVYIPSGALIGIIA